MNIADKRTALEAAIAEFNEAERQLERARDAHAATCDQVNQAIDRDASVYGLIEARAKATFAFSQATEALWVAGQRAVECANGVVVSTAGAAVLIAIADLTSNDSNVLAWREARNALITNSNAPLPTVRAA